jgi:hypothetical protein
MRKNSPRQSEASRANGAKSRGPKSSDTKGKVRLNALKEGLFSKELVIEGAGEKKEDFDNLKAASSEFFEPANVLEEMLVDDYVLNWWRRQRVRRAEAAELRNRVTSLMRDKFKRSDQVEALKVQFIVLADEYRAPSPTANQPDDLRKTIFALEEIRAQLASTSPGLEFLIQTIKDVRDEAVKKGEISARSETRLRASCGFAHEGAWRCVDFNQFKKRQGAEPGTSSKEGPPKDNVSGSKPEADMSARLNRAFEVLEREDASKEAPPPSAAPSPKQPTRSPELPKEVRSWKDIKKLFEELDVANEEGSNREDLEKLAEEFDVDLNKERGAWEDIKKLLEKFDVDLNTEVKKEKEKEKKNEDQKDKEKKKSKLREAFETDEQIRRQVLLAVMIDNTARALVVRQTMIRAVEEWESRDQDQTAILPSGSVPDRFSRAETTYERQMYRAIGMLTAMRLAAEKSKTLSG